MAQQIIQFHHLFPCCNNKEEFFSVFRRFPSLEVPVRINFQTRNITANLLSNRWGFISAVVSRYRRTYNYTASVSTPRTTYLINVNRLLEKFWVFRCRKLCFRFFGFLTKTFPNSNTFQSYTVHWLIFQFSPRKKKFPKIRKKIKIKLF